MRVEGFSSDWDQCVNLGRDSEDSAVSQRHVRTPSTSSVAVCSRAVHSLRQQEDMLRKKFARQLVVLARGVAAESLVLFHDRVRTTLRRHIGNWRK